MGAIDEYFESLFPKKGGYSSNEWKKLLEQQQKEWEYFIMGANSNMTIGSVCKTEWEENGRRVVEVEYTTHKGVVRKRFEFPITHTTGTPQLQKTNPPKVQDIKQLQRQLDIVVKEERYEEAVFLRDRIKKMMGDIKPS